MNKKIKNQNRNIYLKEIEIKYKIKKVKGTSKIVGKKVISSEIVAKLFADLQNETKEKFITINLDIHSKILCFEVVAIGSLDTIYVRPMEAFRTSMMVNAHGAIVVHNHPSGDPEPSSNDKALTEKLLRMSEDMGLKFHDHIIIGVDGYFSFLDEGLLNVY